MKDMRRITVTVRKLTPKEIRQSAQAAARHPWTSDREFFLSLCHTALFHMNESESRRRDLERIISGE